MAELITVLKQIGIGLSLFLRYGYAGMFVLLATAIAYPDQTKAANSAIGPALTATALIVFGAAIYAFHRALVIPVSHLGLCAIFRLCDRKKAPSEVHSPTRYLRNKFGVKCFWRIAAYTCIRYEKDKQGKTFFGDFDRLDVEHAQGNILVMTFSGCIVLLIIRLVAKSSTWDHVNVALALVALVTLIGSYVREFGQHAKECQRLKAADETEVKKVLKANGIPME